MRSNTKPSIINALLVWFLGVVMSSVVLSEDTNHLSPLQLVDVTVKEVVADMNTNEAIYSEDPDKLHDMVLERVAPHFNFYRMTQLAMARYWSQANPEQRRQISDDMLQLMVRTYANSMFKFRNHPLTLEDEKVMNERSAVVRMSVNTDSGQKVTVMLRMEKRKGRWQVIDVVIDGVSMVITYRGIFAEEISKGGIDGLIESIKSGDLSGGSQ